MEYEYVYALCMFNVIGVIELSSLQFALIYMEM